MRIAAIIPVFAILMAVGTTLIWIKELMSPHLKQNLLTRREGDHLVWPHIAIEAFTAILLLGSGILSLLHIGWAPLINFFSLGAITYACFNSLSWTLAAKNRWPYTIYMLFGIIGSTSLMVMAMVEMVS